ncbi:MAG: chromate transporter [Eubacteriales bacterium]
MPKAKKVLRMFLVMVKIGLFTFGGGYAMIALLESELVAKRKWLEKDEFLDMVAVSESTPGPVAVNMATFIGYRKGGVAGAAFSTLGVCLPSFLIIFGISFFFDAFLSLSYVSYAFKGIRVCVIYLILSSGWKLLKTMERTPFSLLLFGTVFSALLIFSLLSVRFSSVLYILLSALAGFFLYLIQKIRKGADK